MTTSRPTLLPSLNKILNFNLWICRICALWPILYQYSSPWLKKILNFGPLKCPKSSQFWPVLYRCFNFILVEFWISAHRSALRQVLFNLFFLGKGKIFSLRLVFLVQACHLDWRNVLQFFPEFVCLSWGNVLWFLPRNYLSVFGKRLLMFSLKFSVCAGVMS